MTKRRKKRATKKRRRVGRPVKTFSRAVFIMFCKLQATLPEIAGAFECDENTVQAWCNRTFGQNFSVIFDRYRGQGNISLRRKQNQVALAGNVKMLIWLGKNRLNQSDKQDVNLSGSVKVVRDSIPKEEPAV